MPNDHGSDHPASKMLSSVRLAKLLSQDYRTFKGISAALENHPEDEWASDLKRIVDDRIAELDLRFNGPGYNELSEAS